MKVFYHSKRKGINIGHKQVLEEIRTDHYKEASLMLIAFLPKGITDANKESDTTIQQS